MKHVLLLLALIGTAGCLTTVSPSPSLPPVPTLSVPRAQTPSVIDGRLDAKEWAGAAMIPALLPCRGELAGGDPPLRLRS